MNPLILMAIIAALAVGYLMHYEPAPPVERVCGQVIEGEEWVCSQN